MPATVTSLLTKIANLIINPLIVLGFVVATVYLFYGIVEMIYKADSNDLEKSRTNVKYGVIGMLVMFSVFGLLRLALNTFGIPCKGFFC